LAQKFCHGVGILALSIVAANCRGDVEKRSGATRRVDDPSRSTSAVTPAPPSAPAKTAAPPNAPGQRPPANRGGDGTPLRAARGGRMMQGPGGSQNDQNRPGIFDSQADPSQPATRRRPREQRMQRAEAFDGDLRNLPRTRPIRKRERPEREHPPVRPVPFPGTPPAEPAPNALAINAPSLPAPAPIRTFEGLDFATWGAGHPPDTNGDVGTRYFIETVNTSIGIFDKLTGDGVAAFTFNTFMSQGNFGNLCDTNNFGDPIVLYDTFEDRWIITDFAFQLDGSSNVVNPPGAFQCIAVSKSGDPVSGGWNFYSINTTGGLGDYPKFGIWPDGLYMSANMFNYAAGGAFQNVRLYAFNKTQMYAGTPSIQVVSFDAPSSEFTLLPSNARLQTGTPPPGSPNYFATVWNFLNVVGVWKFHVDWNSISTSTLTGPFNVLTPTSWSQLTLGSGRAPSPGNSLDTLYPRLMVQNQYSNIGGVESLWNSHTVGASGSTSAQAAVRYYQVTVTGGTVAATSTQAATHSPDATVHRYMVSTAVDRAGNMALGYSASSSTLNPALRYAGRLAGDAVNTITQTEASLFEGTGTQSGTCGSTCTRWGDYSAMTLDVDGCTFWYTNEYYQVTGLNDHTRIGSFAFPECTAVTSGTLQGTVRTTGLTPLVGATVTLGSRTATTDAAGLYAFADLPVGTYPAVTASLPGFASQTFLSIAVNQAATTTQNFTLSAAPANTCFVDTTQADFQAGIPTNCDLTTSPGDVTLTNAPTIDQQNLTVTSSGFGMTSTSWAAQTFLSAVTGQATRIDLDLFCSGCTGTTPNLTVSIRATTGSPAVPTGADLAVATIPGFSSGSGGYFTATFASPATLTAGTRYAVVIRAVSNPSAGTYAYVCSCTSPSSNPYTNGQRVTSANSGSTWTADTTSGGRDLGFKVFVKTGFAASGDFVSSIKDANPAPGLTPTWGTLSWNASVPANTTLNFQAAASTSLNGPFNFVGPDLTSSTFFSNGASLAQFNGNRYLKYKAVLTSSNSGATPTINDVTVCSVNPLPTIATLNPSSVSLGSGDFTLTVTGTNFIGTSTVRVDGADRVTTFSSATQVTAEIVACDVVAAGTPTITVVNPVPGGGTSNGLTLTVTDASVPSITTQPQSQTIASGQTASLSVVASSVSALTYQWYVGTSGDTAHPVGGATGSSYTASPLTTTNYWVRVRNLFGAVDSNTATITVVCSFRLTPASARFGLPGGSGSAVVTTQAGCSWSASTPASWLVLGTSSGTNGSTMTFTARPNATGLARSTSITVGNQPFVVTERVRDTITLGDLDGDSKADIAVFRPSTGGWVSLNSSTSYGTNSAVLWGESTDKPVPGDYDGDGRIDPAFYRPSTGEWHILQSSTSYMSSSRISWGISTDIPVQGDYDGDGKTDLGVYRPSTGQWYILLSSSNYTTYFVRSWGLAIDVPVPSDYDGDGKIDIGVYRPSTGEWYILRSSLNYTTYFVQRWGAPTDISVPGDYDGDGRADIAVYRASTGEWYVLRSSLNYTTYFVQRWGAATDVPVAGDYDGDGRTDIGVYRPSTGDWYILRSSTNFATYFVQPWGFSTDQPILKRP
jgi:hypothetical protein